MFRSEPATTPKVFRAASWPRERFYLSNDMGRSASVEPHSWTSDEPIVVRERWAFRRAAHTGFLITLRSKFAGDWRTRQTLRTPDLAEAITMAKRWVRQTESEGR